MQKQEQLRHIEQIGVAQPRAPGAEQPIL